VPLSVAEGCHPGELLRQGRCKRPRWVVEQFWELSHRDDLRRNQCKLSCLHLVYEELEQAPTRPSTWYHHNSLL
jgi:hypothetical protein